MNRIFDIVSKDLLQMMRDRNTFLFLLLMPVVFTLMFGYAFGGFGSAKGDPRLAVAYLDQDNGRLSPALASLLQGSGQVVLQADAQKTPAELEKLVSSDKLAAAILVPPGYSQAFLSGTPLKLVLIARENSSASATTLGVTTSATTRLSSAVRAAAAVSQAAGPGFFDAALSKAIQSWQTLPVGLVSLQPKSDSSAKSGSAMLSLAQTSPGMMLQFAIAGLLTAAQIMVSERKTRTLQRLLTTATSRLEILAGHYLSIFLVIFVQLCLMILFGQIVFKLEYLGQPLATFWMALVSALCIAGLGLLIGVLAKSDEQAIIFSLIPMFVFAGLGGVWVPLEVTGKAFQAIGHLTPLAWAMDGFQNILARGLGFQSALLPSAMLALYALLFILLAAWRFQHA